MHIRPTFHSVFTVVSILLSSVTVTALGAEAVTITSASGRSFVGFVDSRTDAETLWIRSVAGSSYVLRPIRWSRVKSATVGQEHYTRERLATGFAQLVVPDDFVPPTVEHRVEAAPTMSYARRAQSLLEPTKVTHLKILVSLSNWDADAAPDGLELTVMPLDSHGDLVPVRAGLEVRLDAIQAVDFDQVPRSRGQKLVQLGRWYHRVDRDDMDLLGARFQLPFAALQPESIDTISTHGVVHVRLVVPGHGTFEATEDHLRIKSLSPTRDFRQRQGKSRRFRFEQLDR